MSIDVIKQKLEACKTDLELATEKYLRIGGIDVGALMAATVEIDEALATLSAMQSPVDPDMLSQQLKLHMGELTAGEERIARAAIRWANTRLLGIPEGWQPIETAPRDGTEIVMRNAKSRAVGSWSDYSYSANPPVGGGWFPLIDATEWLPLPPQGETK